MFLSSPSSHGEGHAIGAADCRCWSVGESAGPVPTSRVCPAKDEKFAARFAQQLTARHRVDPALYVEAELAPLRRALVDLTLRRRAGRAAETDPN
jgi:hypothetical protein